MSGVAWAVTAGVGFGLFQAVNRRANTGIDPYLATFSLLVVGTSVLLVVTIASVDLNVMNKAPLVSYAYFAGVRMDVLGAQPAADRSRPDRCRGCRYTARRERAGGRRPPRTPWTRYRCGNRSGRERPGRAVVVDVTR